MGSYSTLCVGDLSIAECKADIDPALMLLFTPGDKRVWKISVEEWVARGYERESWSDDTLYVEYSCSVAEMRDRLELRGYTRAVAVKAFEAAAPRRVAALRAQVKQSNELKLELDHPVDPIYQTEIETKERCADLLERMKPQGWAKSVRILSGLPTRRAWRFDEEEHTGLDDCVQYAMIHSNFGFPCTDERLMLRLLLEEWPDDERVVYDLFDLVESGYFDSSTDMIQYAEYLLSRENDIFRTIVVLTEGSTDRWILERSLKLIMPHLADFFSFMDFEGVRLEGGAGHLAKVVKAFSAAGILNRVVALFDNDTAGNAAADGLRTLPISASIKVLTLPPIDIACEYPALGPSGLSIMDINGLACSLELYLGTDCLTKPTGGLEPIQWKGYDAKLGRYQGELLAKAEVTERFCAKLTTCERDRKRLDGYDWTGIKLVLDMMRSAFHKDDEQAHLEYEGFAEEHFT